MSHHDHHNHDHHMHTDASTVLPTVTTMLANAIANTTQQIMAMAAVDPNAHHMHDPNAHHMHDHHEMEHGNHDNVTEVIDHGDHGGHDGHGGDGSMDHMMPMYFMISKSATILFQEWKVTTTEGMVGSVIGIFFMALLYEGLKFLREYLYREHFHAINYSSVAVMGQNGKTTTELHKITKNRIFGWPHLLQTSLHIVQVLVSYFLMLIFMTYNVWLCLGVLLGSGVGYFLFGWRKATIVDISEHCH